MLVRIAQALAGVVTLERLTELVEEVEKLGDRLVGQFHWQAHERQIIGLP